MNEKDDIITFVDYVWVIWAEPDEGSYNYHMCPLRSRWNPTPRKEIPRELAGRIIAKASSSYPIVIIDGYDFDGVIDKFMTHENSDHNVIAVFGDFPRDYYESRKDSVKEFMEAVKSGEVF